MFLKILFFFYLSLNKTLKLFVAGYDGVVCVYEVNTNDGGECKQISQYLLFSMSPNTNNQQTITTNEIRNSPNDNTSGQLSSTPPTPTGSTKNVVHPNDEQNYSRLSSTPQGVYD